ncbi:MAG: hypothetical protein KKD38_10005 [Candidatus Delongbacteria bacterium]|nr:hypothetical protein [Candidatus Delongbacteria bacterium]MCG2759781.1 hypothetical protein [Candidatus Delongbacteria bacterium]
MPKLDNDFLQTLKDSRYWDLASVYVELYEENSITADELLVGLAESVKKQLNTDITKMIHKSLHDKDQHDDINA